MKSDDIDYSHPVAYDAEGKPLYAHPPKEKPRVVHVSRAVEPEKPVISEEVKERHERSQRLYPHLNLSEGEYVISAVRRHPIGLIIPMIIGAVMIILALLLLVNYTTFVNSVNLNGVLAEPSSIVMPMILFCVLVVLGLFVVYYVYTNNKFFLTNESVIQEIQASLFSKLEQTVSLANIEDASFTQDNVIQYMFNYGSIRLSTEGDETTYRFTYVANPKMHIAMLNNAVEAFKNGRPTFPD